MRGLWRIQQWWRRSRERAALRQAERAVARFPRIRSRRPHGLPHPLIVSLTSYPARYPTLAKTLKSLLDQDVAADRTILWIAQGDAAALPQEVRALEAQGLEIRLCEDLRSFKKLIPALQAFPDAAIVTADDDVYYGRDWLGRLVAASDPSDPAILCHRAHIAEIESDGRFRSYWDWPKETEHRSDLDSGRRIFPTGVGGILYPPAALDDGVLDVDAFQRICPSADDIWFFWMGELRGTPQRRVEGRCVVVAWDGSQDVGLIQQNVFGHSNDRQLTALFAEAGSALQVGSRP